MIHLTLPYPPSSNTIYSTGEDNRRHLTPTARRYRADVGDQVLVQLVGIPRPLTERLALWVWIYPKYQKRRFDRDNLCKLMQDSLQHAGVIVNDSQIEAIHLLPAPYEPGGKLEVELWPFPEEDWHIRLMHWLETTKGILSRKEAIHGDV